MKAAVGDRIVTASGVVGGAVRDGVVVELRDPAGAPPYLVEWSDTGERTLVFPGSDSYVEHTPGARDASGTPSAPSTSSKVWRVQVAVLEDDGRTTAEAVLVADAPDRLRAIGEARKDPGDVDVPAIGDEIAVGRALRRLSDRLLGIAESDIESSTGAPAHVHH
ncbi:dsRBD fold-containing protein [Oerskovia flava]|uniref:dsRBD fold-containing protein n=1 Tax=Oerskovia flava TaxID=2986422 RepID=UPI00223FB8F4|nr:dsRBD fold-containing protein [Oerskovia sp. JB1-3-2]